MKIFNPQLKEELVNELFYLDSEYFQFDIPVPFKKGLNIYPVSTRNYNKFMICTECLTLDRTEAIEGLSTTNLGYLLMKMADKEEGAKYSQYFSTLCELCFKAPSGIKCTKCGKFYTIPDMLRRLAEKSESDPICECGANDDFEETLKYKIDPKTKKHELIINGITIDDGEFDRIRQIIMYQNLPDYKDDSWVDPVVKEDQEAKRKILARKNKMVDPGIERKIVCVSSQTCYTMEELYELSIRKFLMLLNAVDDAMTYMSTRIGLMTGVVSSKEPIEHWIYKKEEEDIYGSAVDAEAFENKIKNVKS